MIQIDMQMPKNCIDCPACNEYLMCAIPCNGRGWGENDVKEFSQSRPEWCPMNERKKVKIVAVRAELDYGSWHYECPVCNGYVDAHDKFCRYCGVPLEV